MVVQKLKRIELQFDLNCWIEKIVLYDHFWVVETNDVDLITQMNIVGWIETMDLIELLMRHLGN